MAIPGHVTAEGTARYAARQVARGAAAGHFRAMGPITVGSIGLGTYLGPENDATDRAYEIAARGAVDLGANVLDSAINYRAQRSERAIGRAIEGLVADGSAARDELLVATKGGYLPFDGGRPADPAEFVRRTYVDTGLLSARDVVAGCHSIAPRYLADQLERSRGNLGVEVIDVYYLHNPEQQLEELDRPAFLARMRAAFEWLESCVAAGSIGVYGTATWNGYRQGREARDYLSLEELDRLAREVGGHDHHFRVVQLPYNLAMAEAHALSNQTMGDGVRPILEVAKGLGISVMASASVYQGHLTRGLPGALGEVLGGLQSDAQRALQFVRSTPGVTVALVGMKTRAHVEENLALARAPIAPPGFLERLFETPGGPG